LIHYVFIESYFYIIITKKLKMIEKGKGYNSGWKST